MTCLLIDDERLARQELRRLLEAHPQMQVLGEAANGREATKLIAEHAPDVIFLDIQMPGQTGFELISALPEPLPLVVFVTAYDDHAVRAFDVQALDYLVKPVEPERLALCMTRLDLLLDASPELPAVESDETPDAEHALSSDDRVLLRDGERFWFVRVSDIFLLESERNYTRVHFTDGNAVILRTLSSLEARLPSPHFFRASRAQMINTKHIMQVQPWFSQSIKVKLRNGTDVEFSRRQAQVFRERMSL